MWYLYKKQETPQALAISKILFMQLLKNYDITTEISVNFPEGQNPLGLCGVVYFEWLIAYKSIKQTIFTF